LLLSLRTRCAALCSTDALRSKLVSLSVRCSSALLLRVTRRGDTSAGAPAHALRRIAASCEL
jgi:hypothetical protein